MSLPPDFIFNQSNLQDYLDCPRRFELRYLLKVRWPALKTEPVLEQERHIRLGERFHHLVYQYLAGFSLEDLDTQITEPQLAEWWHHFKQSDLLGSLPHNQLAEHTLSAPFEKYRLAAKYDLLAVDPEKSVVIVDWKTLTHKPAFHTLKSRVQSRLYPFLVILAARYLNGGKEIIPQQVEMVYWFSNFPQQVERFQYSQYAFEEDHEFLKNMVGEIASTPDGNFLYTPEEKTCRYCNYRSLCNRGEKAGDWIGSGQDLENDDYSDRLLDIDFDQIGEIAF